ncbi:hypothetical protein Taro_035612 [Colocasia esculenta]|uniref:Lachrymatory factor synthase n=1 Tax=Colocasia esculenta TaxID=4460 RepID=A0A843WFC8_COLES|nr:hypothetical protein [Colocasia esculenta]
METQEATWEGSAQAKLPAATADEAWSLLEDFSGIHRLLPGIKTCTLVDGANGVPGCTRHCVGPPVPSENGGEPTVYWATERLLSFDAAERSYSYEVTDSNMGFRRYVATLRAKPEGGVGAGGGCRLEWSFAADPVEGWSRDRLVGYLQYGLEEMGRRIEEAVKAGFLEAAAKSGEEEKTVKSGEEETAAKSG